MLDSRYWTAYKEMRHDDASKHLGYCAFMGMPVLYDFDIYCSRTAEDAAKARCEKFKFMANHGHDPKLV